ncbi:MAG: carboxyltransferase domain-containing protein [Actinobacteria bacterium]|nr:carboxyltransferase domain-containing protein [Actinomycetota bacterium]MSY76573.1 carboxyltransferase domain-containing protein [Actinomycetota bacterium]
MAGDARLLHRSRHVTLPATSPPSTNALSWRRFGNQGVLLDFDNGEVASRWCRAINESPLDARARPGWRSVLVESTLSSGALIEAISVLPLDTGAERVANEVTIDVTYTGDDLDNVAAATSMSREEVIARHCAPTYTVVCLGFSRAFPYLSGLDPRLWLPRHDTPRVRVPSGSVAIAVDQAGIYPQTSPGGWHLLGHTNAVLFDPNRDQPSLLQPGDHVRFARLSA